MRSCSGRKLLPSVYLDVNLCVCASETVWQCVNLRCSLNASIFQRHSEGIYVRLLMPIFLLCLSTDKSVALTQLHCAKRNSWTLMNTRAENSMQIPFYTVKAVKSHYSQRVNRRNSPLLTRKIHK